MIYPGIKSWHSWDSTGFDPQKSKNGLQSTYANEKGKTIIRRLSHIDASLYGLNTLYIKIRNKHPFVIVIKCHARMRTLVKMQN